MTTDFNQLKIFDKFEANVTLLFKRTILRQKLNNF